MQTIVIYDTQFTKCLEEGLEYAARYDLTSWYIHSQYLRYTSLTHNRNSTELMLKLIMRALVKPPIFESVSLIVIDTGRS